MLRSVQYRKNSMKMEPTENEINKREEDFITEPRIKLLQELSDTVLSRQAILSIDFSQQNLKACDTVILKLALMFNCSRLHSLKLAYNNFGDDGIRSISSCLGAAAVSLKTLDLGFTSLSDTGCIMISRVLMGENADIPATVVHPPFMQLETLYLAGNCIGQSGGIALASLVRSKACMKLKTINLSANRIGPKAICELAKAFEDTAATIEHLCLQGTEMKSEGCLAVSNMLLDNLTIRTIDLSGNDLTDKNLVLLSQSLSRTKAPLTALRLSFNLFSCTGTESLMNALWGSKTLHDLKMDNNKIGDRGAQLIAVMLTSVSSIAVLDIGFNKISSVGVKALMKAIAESKTLRDLTLSGNRLDVLAAKTVAFMLAHNKSLANLFIDHCSVSYQAQRHISAGVVSNKDLALASLTGFRLGSIVVSLGFPADLDQWPNEKILAFIRFMWDKQRKNEANNLDENGPMNPVAVIDVARKTFSSFRNDGVSEILRKPPYQDKNRNGCPVSVEEARITICEQVQFDTLQRAIPKNQNGLSEMNCLFPDGLTTYPSDTNTVSTADNVTVSTIGTLPSLALHDSIGVERFQRNTYWVCRNFKNLNGLVNKPYDYNELMALHIFVLSVPEGECLDFDEAIIDKDVPIIAKTSTSVDRPMVQEKSDFISGCEQINLSNATTPRFHVDSAGDVAVTKRRSFSDISLCTSLEKCKKKDEMPMKRARNSKKRIEYYPRVKVSHFS